MMETPAMQARLIALAAALALGAAAPAFAQAQRAAPAPAASRQADYIVAVVNSEPITNNEVRIRMARFEQQLAQQGNRPPPRQQLAREVLERLISEKAQLQLAREIGVRADEAMIDQAEQNIARQNQVDVNELRRRLRSEGMDPAQFREDLRNQLLLQRLRERELEPKVRVSELDIDQFLREQQSPEAELASTEINLAHILVAVPENAAEAQVTAARAKAQRALDRARAGEDFAKLAGELSDAPGAAANGGQVGLRTVDRLPPLFVDAIRNVQAGGLAQLVRSAAGFHVVKVLERRKGAGLGTVVQSRARHILLRPGPQLTEAQARARLAEFKQRIAAGRGDFAQLAREHSQDASSRNGGDLGWASPGLFVPEFEEVVNSLQPGQIADPIVSRFGVHLIQLVERRQAQLSDREKREMAKNMLREKKLDEAYAQWAQEVRGRAYVELREAPQ
jgi:peptidyl-prolyl cis-trans isomerase SurA